MSTHLATAHVAYPTANPLPNPAADRLISAGLASIGIREDGGDNRGTMVDLYLSEVGLAPGQPWCAAFVYHIGYWSQYDTATQHSSWPLPKTAGCAILGEFAASHDILRDTPSRGSIFLLYEPTLGRFGHTGVITNVDERDDSFTCTTIEGNTNTDGSREGRRCCYRTRRFAKGGRSRFIDWWEMTR